jgi:hydroxymethylbilane synthase
MRIGTRGSALALAQSEFVRAALSGDGSANSLRVIKTLGDLNPQAALARIGGKGVFTKEIEDALLAGEIDLAVHSLKDLPTESPAGLTIGALLRREDPRDALISRSGAGLDQLPAKAVIGTSSPRRRSQILARRPDVMVQELRGNVPTRLARLEEGRFDAVVVAAAGLRRLNLIDRATELLSEEVMLPAPGQGIVAIQIRDGDAATQAAVRVLDDPTSRAEGLAERSLLAGLEGGCLVPVGARARAEAGAITLAAFVGHPDGRPHMRRTASGRSDAAAEVGATLAIVLLELGARNILDEVRSSERFP